jgi:hypothetical protein
MLDILQSQGASAAFSQRYRVTRELGRGGMGQVFLAMDLRSGESVAIKTLLAEADAESLERLRREALALEQIRHPNLVKLLELSLEGRRPFLVMELVVGESLEELIRQAGPVTDKRSFDRRAQWLEEVCSAVAVIHEAGLVHRDIKPSNIMICAKTGRAILLDLGIVGRDRSSDSSMAGALGPTLTKTQQSLGTPHYMAPEQIDSALASLGPRADVWSLGALAFFLVSGEPPYEDCDEVTFFARRMNLAARSLRKLNPFCPRWFSDLAAEALKREPAERLELRALREALAARDFRSSKRPVGLIALAFGLILSLALCGAWIWSSLQRAARQAGKEALEARLREGEGQLEGGRPVPLEALRACAKDYEGLGGGPLLAWAEGPWRSRRPGGLAVIKGPCFAECGPWRRARRAACALDFVGSRACWTKARARPPGRGCYGPPMRA